MKIGFVGLGHMGFPMAHNLLKAGFQVIGFDTKQETMAEWAKVGGLVANNLNEVVQEVDAFITMLQTGDQVKQVCLGEEGLYQAASPAALHIDCSSIDVATAQHLSQEAHTLGLLALDAPVSGGMKGAQAGTLTFMIGGEAEVLAKAEPLLKHLGKKIVHTGKAGTGQAAKICNNMILGMSMIAISEAFILAEELGLSAENLFNVVNHSSGQCWALSQYAPIPGLLPDTPASHDYKPGFSAAMMLKDLHLSQFSAACHDLQTPLAAQATKLYETFVQKEGGEWDFSAIIKMLKDKR